MIERYVIGSIDLDTGLSDVPMPKQFRVAYMPILKAAALILIGFAVGFGSSRLSHREPVTVIPQRLQVGSPSGSIVQYTSCEPIDLHSFHTPTVPDSMDT